MKKKNITPEILEEMLAKQDWKFFENFVETLLKIHGFKTKKHVRVKMRRKWREIDIIGYDDLFVLVVECKRWSKGRYKISLLKKEAKKHKERINFITSSSLFRKKKFVGIVVTLFEEGITNVDGIFFVPIWKLNRFLLELSYLI